MGLLKLSAEEARQRRKESVRKYRERPDVKQKKREADKKRQAIFRVLGKTINHVVGKSGDCVKKYRSDPVKYERQMALQRERRARKRQNIQIGSDSKRVCFDAESGVLWNKTRSKYLQAISDGPIH
ncbi:hypothetical protein TNCV_471711 [Trichonephila clavipes]|uniref:Uncharacterized protein n=1 Tax=Trichonephila clavipes TaxID=2585209 RepID=A0A8X6RGC8_TRICX|nr:hypothetical protein TNCV_471711 [Trichonephila clavipes]